MTREEAVQLATAIAKANQHPSPEEWAEKVGEFLSPAPPARAVPPDPPASIEKEEE